MPTDWNYAGDIVASETFNSVRCGGDRALRFTTRALLVKQNGLRHWEEQQLGDVGGDSALRNAG
jgi:glycosyltransferase A (GT-A) superfamily protein (DUF2064 family)